MKKILLSIAGVLVIAVVLVLFINAKRADKAAPCCAEPTTVEVVKESSEASKATCPGMTGSEMPGCQQECKGAAVATK